MPDVPGESYSLGGRARRAATAVDSYFHSAWGPFAEHTNLTFVAVNPDKSRRFHRKRPTESGDDARTVAGTRGRKPFAEW